jgi:tetratricopeptide (TPR) repeat protein
MADLENILNNSKDLASDLALSIIDKIAKKDINLAEIILATSLPHRCNTSVIAALQSNKENHLDSQYVMALMSRLSFVSFIQSDLFVYHEKIRETFLKLWREPNKRNLYISYSLTLKEYFENNNDYKEALYHWFVISPNQAFQEFDKRIDQELSSYEFTEAEILLRLAKQQSWNLTGWQVLWIEFLEINLEHGRLSHLDKVITGYEEILPRIDSFADIPLSAKLRLKIRVLDGLGFALYQVGRLPEAIQSLEKSLETAREQDNSSLTLLPLLTLGWIYLYLHNPDQATTAFEEVLYLSRQSNFASGESWSLDGLGATFAYKESWKTAIEYYQRSLEIRMRMQSELLIGRSLSNLGSIYLKLGEFNTAISYLEDASSRQNKIEDLYGLSYTYKNIGHYYQYLKQWQKSIEFYEKSLEIRKNLDLKREIENTLIALAQVYSELGLLEKELQFRNEARQIHEQLEQIMRRDKTNEQ